jgi:hypothetical protein
MRRLLWNGHGLSIPAAALLGACQGGTIINGGMQFDGGNTGPVVKQDGQVVPAWRAVATRSSGAAARTACTGGKCEFGHTQPRES